MKKTVLLRLCLFMLSSLYAKDYLFEGITYMSSIDLLYCFDNGKFEVHKYLDTGEWEIKSYPYEMIQDDGYLIAKLNKDNSIDNLYIFNADKNHILIYDSNLKETIIATEKKGHRDEPWIYSARNVQSSSFLTEFLRGEKVSYKPENLGLYKLPFSWVEGVEGYGEGEKISFDNWGNGSRKIYIINGFFAPDKPRLFYDNNRVKELLINCYKGNELISTESRILKDTGEMQLLEFSQRYDSFDFIIKSVYYGKKYNDTAITGIFIDALDCYEE